MLGSASVLDDTECGTFAFGSLALTEAQGDRPPCVLKPLVFGTYEDARPFWDVLQRTGVCTVYQSIEWITSYFRHVSKNDGAEAFVVGAVDDNGVARFLLPLQITTRHGLRIASFVGGAHSNFNFPLIAGNVPAIDPTSLHSLLIEAGKTARVDMFALVQQPGEWRGYRNPFCSLNSTQSPNDGHAISLGKDIESSFLDRISKDRRRKLQQKKRILEAQAGLQYCRAGSDAEAAEVMDAFFVQKAKRMQKRGIPDPFAGRDIRQFLLSTAQRADQSGAPLIELHYLKSRFGILAIYGLLANDGSCSALFNSYDGPPDIIRHGPGLVLLHYIVQDLIHRGCAYFDMGTGDAAYKQEVCNEQIMLFDSMIPLTAKGRIAAMIVRLALKLKGRIKRSPELWKIAERVRKIRAGYSSTS